MRRAIAEGLGRSARRVRSPVVLCGCEPSSGSETARLLSEVDRLDDLVNDGRERLRRLDLPIWKIDVDSEPRSNHCLFLCWRPRERSRQLPTHGFRDAKPVVQRRDEHKSRWTLLDVPA